MSTGFSFFGEVTDVLDVLSRQPQASDIQRMMDKTLTPASLNYRNGIPISELILGVRGNSKRESPDFESPVVAISANDG